MSDDNKWKQPEAPPPPLFLGEKERDLVKQVNDELIERVIVHFHKRRLTEDQDMFVREGDFIVYGDVFYEIVTLAEPKQMFGQIDHRMEISAKCIRAREGLFDAS